MRLLLEKDEAMVNVLGGTANVVDGKWFYIPGWFEKHENGDVEFHHMNSLPEELTNRLIQIREEQQKAMEEAAAQQPVTEAEAVPSTPKRRSRKKKSE